MERLGWPDRRKRPNRLLHMVKVDERRKVQIREAVGVVCQECLFARKQRLNALESLADVAGSARVDECDIPIVNVAAQQPNVATTTREHKIVRHALVVIQEVFLDYIRLPAKTQNEI